MAYRAQGGSVPKRTLAVSRFKGVDLAGNPTAKSPARADWAINMVTDNNGYPQTRHGYEKVLELTGRVNGVHRLETTVGTKTLIHSGNRLSLWENDTLTLLTDQMSDARSVSAQLDNKLLILDGKRARVYADWSEDDEEPDFQLKNADEEGYVPTVRISAVPGLTPGGTSYENINMVSMYQYNQFLVATAVPASDENCVLRLSDTSVDDVTVERRNAVGEWQVVSSSQYSVNAASGIVDFTTGTEGLIKTDVTGQDNYRVKFKSAHNATRRETQAFSYETDTVASPAGEPVYICYLRSEGSSSTMVAVLPEDYNTSTYRGKLEGYRYRFELENSDVNYGGFYFELQNATPAESGSYRFTFSGLWELTELSADFADYDDSMVLVDKKWGPYPSAQEVIYTDVPYEPKYTGKAEAWFRLLTENGRMVLEVVSYVTYTKSEFDSAATHTGTLGIRSGSLSYTRDVEGTNYIENFNRHDIIQKYGYGGTGDRIFIAGNPEKPATDHWSDINNPLYFPDQNYAQVGDETTPIMGYSWLSDGSLAIHKGWNGSDSSVYYRESTTYEGEATFTLRQGAIGWGVVSKWGGAYLQGEPLQLSEQGVFATVPTYNLAINDRYAQDRSYFINPLLIKQNLSEAVGISFRNKYYLSAGDYVFVADGGQQSYSYKGDKRSYEWYVWDNIPARIWWTDGDDLYFGSEDGKLYKFNDGYEDDGEPIKWEWTTPWLDFGTLVYYKKVKNVAVLAAPDLWQNPHVEYRFPLKPGKVKHLLQNKEQEAPWLKTTNYKAKKIGLMQVHIFGDKPCGLSAINILYSTSGKIKG